MARKTIAIRKEDKSVWEKRVPLIPEDVAELKTYGIDVVVQSSDIRIFKDEEYKKIGAVISAAPDAPFVFGVKEIPENLLVKNTTYIFFSHTIKGQSYNMSMLKKLMSLGNTLIDYEKIVDDSGRRLIAFGKFAGIAGMIDTLWALGQRWKWEGKHTPLASLKQARCYFGLEEFYRDAKIVAEEIANGKLCESLIVGIAGYGNVSKGAQEVLELFPVKEISPDELIDLKNTKDTIYKVVFREEDMVFPRNGAAFDLAKYYLHPEQYQPVFEKYLPHLTTLVNATYWDEKYPRLVTKKWLRESYSENLKVIGDLGCDIEGAIEINVKTTEPGEPVYCYHPETGKIAMGFQGKGPVVLAVDILPSELPKDASVYFSDKLKQFAREIVEAQYPEDFDKCNLPDHLKRAVIVYKGKLTPSYKYINKYLEHKS